MVRREVPGSRFITFSCQKRLPLFTNPAIADTFAACIARARQRWNFRLFAWVIMPEHVHLLLRPPDDQPLAPILKSMKLALTERVLPRWRELNAPILGKIDDGHGSPRFWQKGGGFDRNVRGDRAFARDVRYIHRNPVERGLVERPEQWRWSSVRWWLGMRDGELECDAPRGDIWIGWTGFQ